MNSFPIDLFVCFLAVFATVFLDCLFLRLLDKLDETNLSVNNSLFIKFTSYVFLALANLFVFYAVT